MKYNYPQLIRKMCKMSVAVLGWKILILNGTNECKYADEPIKEIKNILGIGEQMKI